jgi:hypothetical protein
MKIMTRNIFLYLRTISYLTSKQIFYQVYYRLKPVKSLLHFKINAFQFSFLRFSDVKNYSKFYEGDNIFVFLNLSHKFNGEINWNFREYGQLWNFRLQSFELLQQGDIPIADKEKWLIDIGGWLENGRLKLEPYPVSLRLMNTIRFLSLNKINNKKINEQTVAQLTFLNNHLEYHVSGNHLLENAFALFMGGHAFKNVAWQQKARKLLCNELEKQILNDGGHFELSPMYHQIVLFRLMELIDWYGKLEKFDVSFLSFITEKANLMLGWLRAISLKNGTIPNFNDSSIGIALPFGELLKLAAALKLSPAEKIKLNDSGYRKFSFDDYECVIDIGEIGPSYQAGHGHADALTFMLYKSGHPIIVEVGTSTYQKGQRRDFERSTFAHNTVVVKEQNQSEVWGIFRVGRRASVNVIKESETQLEAKHNGYYRSMGIYHTRKFCFSEKEIKITDRIGDTSGKLLLHFHSDCKLQVMNNSLLIQDIAKVTFEGAKQVALKEYEFSVCFNQYNKAFKVEVDFETEMKTTVKFL